MTEKGYLLVEVSIAYLIMALAITALVPAFIISIKANKNTEKIQVAVGLSRELLEEVRLRKWDENASYGIYTTLYSTSLSTDTGETATNKTTFDDVDDFNGWFEDGAKDPMNGSLSQFSAYERSVAVVYVTSANAVSAATTDWKRITVCTKTDGLSDVCLATLVTNR